LKIFCIIGNYQDLQINFLKIFDENLKEMDHTGNIHISPQRKLEVNSHTTFGHPSTFYYYQK
jgi:hypothetical protein